MDHMRAAVVWQKGRRVGRTEGPFGPENSVIEILSSKGSEVRFRFLT